MAQEDDALRQWIERAQSIKLPGGVVGKVSLVLIVALIVVDPHWARWSEEKLSWHAERDLLAVNPIIYAEVSAHFSTLEELDEVLSPVDFQRLPLRYEAGFLAAKCFLA
jgi:hypothetical protein